MGVLSKTDPLRRSWPKELKRPTTHLVCVFVSKGGTGRYTGYTPARRYKSKRPRNTFNSPILPFLPFVSLRRELRSLDPPSPPIFKKEGLDHHNTKRCIYSPVFTQKKHPWAFEHVFAPESDPGHSADTEDPELLGPPVVEVRNVLGEGRGPREGGGETGILI